jgi:hypothetical protein
MNLEELRRRAEACLRFAESVEDQEIAVRLRVMAGEYLMMVDMEGEHLMQAATIDHDPAAAEAPF